MKKIVLSLLIVLHASSNIWASCMSEPHSLTELLLHDERNRSIFLGEVVSSAATMQGMYFSKVKIQEVFKGEIDQKIVFVYTGGNTSAGGHPLSEGFQYLIFSEKGWSGDYTATVCDPFSCNKMPGNEEAINRLQLVTDFQKMVQSAYSGPVTWYYPEGIKAAEGQFLNGKPEGIWLHYRYDGTPKSETPYQNGLRHGTVVETLENEWGTRRLTYQNGRLLQQFSNYNHSQGQIKSESNTLENDAILNRMHTRTWYPNGVISMDYTRENARNGGYSGFIGPFIKQDSTGRILEQGEYLLGAKTGKWVETDPKTNQQRDTIYAPPVIPAYDFVRFYADGRPAITGQLKNGLPEAKWFFFRQTGGVKQASNFSAGKLSGETLHYCHSSTRILERNLYVDDLLDGEQLGYHENGALRERVTYKMGVKNGPSMGYLESGVKRIQSNYKDGKLQGKYLERDAQGGLRVVAHFEEDALSGIATQYHKRKNICKKSVGTYKNGFKTGEWKFYDCQGKLLQTCQFDGSVSEMNNFSSDYRGNCVPK